ncbi:LOW QUALITY PROTEIN: hypothetical protein MXB_2397 [Myxobolus squamalis]|nr:LOW QUALITY PROTEIN: hypothetical protein MXB_2397 [Myxobolus squamalis]
MARLIVKGEKKKLRKIHEYQGCKQRVEITSTPIVVYINQLSCNFIKQAASDFIKFPHAIYRNLLSKIVIIINCSLINCSKRTCLFLRFLALRRRVCREILGNIQFPPLWQTHDSLSIEIGIAVKWASTNSLLYGPPIKAFRTYRVRAIYSWTQHSKSCYISSISV